VYYKVCLPSYYLIVVLLSFCIYSLTHAATIPLLSYVFLEMVQVREKILVVILISHFQISIKLIAVIIHYVVEIRHDLYCNQLLKRQ
jgi:hypothetical protein